MAPPAAGGPGRSPQLEAERTRAVHAALAEAAVPPPGRRSCSRRKVIATPRSPSQIGRSELATRALRVPGEAAAATGAPGDRRRMIRRRWGPVSRECRSSGGRASCTTARGLLRAARDGPSAVLVIGGEAGVGRTTPGRGHRGRGAAERGFRVGAGACVRMDAGAMPYLAIIAALRALAAQDLPPPRSRPRWAANGGRSARLLPEVGGLRRSGGSPAGRPRALGPGRRVGSVAPAPGGSRRLRRRTSPQPARTPPACSRR